MVTLAFSAIEILTWEKGLKRVVASGFDWFLHLFYTIIEQVLQGGVTVTVGWQTDQRKDRRGHREVTLNVVITLKRYVFNAFHLNISQTIGSQGERKVKILKIFRKNTLFMEHPVHSSFLTWKVLFETVPQTHNLQLSKLLSLFIGRFFWEV